MNSKLKKEDIVDNQWWKLRATHGRAAIFKTPEAMMEAAIEYFEKTNQRKWFKTDFRGKDAKKVQIPTETPYTISGLCIFWGVNVQYLTDFENAIKEKPKKSKKDNNFSLVITTIREIIWTQKFEGASVGAFNSNIISMELGMKAKMEGTITFEQPLFHEDGEDGIKE